MARQDSTEYFNQIWQNDKTLQQYLKNHPEIAQQIKNGTIKIKYQLITTKPDGTITITELILDPTKLNLTLP